MRTIIQSTPIGHSLVNLTAVDSDEGINQEVSFYLEDPHLPFQISHQELTVNSTLEAKILQGCCCGYRSWYSTFKLKYNSHCTS